MRSKFYGIQFPIFTTKKTPQSEFYKQNKIFVVPSSGKEDNLILVDDLSINATYPRRLEIMRLGPYKVIDYDFTCTNLSALLLSRSRWGYDSANKIHYFDSAYKEFRLSYRKVIKIRKNAFWLEGISHPFELPEFLIDFQDLKNLWVGVVYVDFCWHIYDFSPFYKRKDRIKL
jgi:hypothetical protein